MHTTTPAMDDRTLIRTLKALADPKRFRIVQEIAAAGELSCGQVAEKFPIAQPTFSHHLKILTDAGIVSKRTDGKHHFISVDRALLAAVADMLPGRLSTTAPAPAPAAAPRARRATAATPRRPARAARRT